MAVPHLELELACAPVYLGFDYYFDLWSFYFMGSTETDTHVEVCSRTEVGPFGVGVCGGMIDTLLHNLCSLLYIE